jgi:hypothetical protein
MEAVSFAFWFKQSGFCPGLSGVVAFFNQNYQI